MLWSLEGILKECHPEYIIVETQGLGFQVLIPASFYFQAPAPGEKVLIYTFLQVKEEQLVLYGFKNKEERDFFRVLLGVAGIGPRAALSLLGHLELSEITAAILGEKISTLTSVPGIGSKTAKRLIYELKEKLISLREGRGDLDSRIIQAQNPWLEVRQALLFLGYTEQEIMQAKNALAGEGAKNTEELFKSALSFLSR